MAANISDSDILDTQEGVIHGNAAVHELDQIKAEALRDIDEDEGGFSCVANLSLF